MTPERDGETRNRILTAARSVFVRRGTAGARMQEIAEEAGVNQALLHYYFRTKDRLAEAVFRELAARMLPAVVGILGGDIPLDVKIERFVHVYIDAVRYTPFLPGYILAELNFHPERLAGLAVEITGAPAGTLVKNFLPYLAAQLEEEAQSGRMRSISPEQFLVNLFSLCVFPFAARPVLRIALGMDDVRFAAFLDERRAELPGFIRNALRP